MQIIFGIIREIAQESTVNFTAKYIVHAWFDNEKIKQIFLPDKKIVHLRLRYTTYSESLMKYAFEFVTDYNYFKNHYLIVLYPFG